MSTFSTGLNYLHDIKFARPVLLLPSAAIAQSQQTAGRYSQAEGGAHEGSGRVAEPPTSASVGLPQPANEQDLIPEMSR